MLGFGVSRHVSTFKYNQDRAPTLAASDRSSEGMNENVESFIRRLAAVFYFACMLLTSLGSVITIPSTSGAATTCKAVKVVTQLV